MKINSYYFLWNYNKFPLVYSIMKKNERNTLIINIQDSLDLKEKLLKLEELDKIYKIVLIENNFKEYFFNIFYRIFIYPLKNKKRNIRFYLDGFVGYYPITLANIGVPNKVFFYEEGESIYLEKTLFQEKQVLGLKSLLNNFIKKILFIKKNKIQEIEEFFVRDKERLKTISRFSNYNFKVTQVDEIEELKKISNNDKEILKKIFLEEFKIQNKEKNAIVLTQPIYLDNPYTKKESIELFNMYIQKLQQKNYKIYLKLHPKEKEDGYLKYNVERIKGKFPFELLTLLEVEFEIGLTYNSTAINSKLIKNKILIKNEVEKIIK